MIKPVSPLRTRVETIAHGIVLEASLTSSAMCTAESGPIRAYMGPVKATKQAVPMDGQSET